MRSLLTLLLAFGLFIGVDAQTLVVKGKGQPQTEQTLTKTSVKTGQTFEGKPVYKSSRGSLFVVVVSKKTGQPYKKYLEVKK